MALAPATGVIVGVGVPVLSPCQSYQKVFGKSVSFENLSGAKPHQHLNLPPPKQSPHMGGGGGSFIAGLEIPGNNMQSNVQLTSQAYFGQFKRNQNCELTTGTKPNTLSKAEM